MPIINGSLDASIQVAARTLAQGGLVGIPTETVYGLAARTDNDRAVAAIFQAKGRPADHPLIVHVLDIAAAEVFAQQLPAVALRLMEAFWPGPLTVIVPRQPDQALLSAAHQNSIGLRCPAHPVTRALLQALQDHGVMGLSAPSANRFGRLSPTSAKAVQEELGESLLILEGGPCSVGIESAIVDCTRGYPVLLRPGCLPREAIAAAAGMTLHEPDPHAPRASGTLESHYAPMATVRAFESSAWLQQALLEKFKTIALATPTNVKPSAMLAIYACQVQQMAAMLPQIPSWLRLHEMPSNAEQAAHDLFTDLRTMDHSGASEIWVLMPPENSSWEGVRDRLRRAAAQR
jgi:L-threonylcarbamoyladenylate synthase